jgi:hypothetical protein
MGDCGSDSDVTQYEQDELQRTATQLDHVLSIYADQGSLAIDVTAGNVLGAGGGGGRAQKLGESMPRQWSTIRPMPPDVMAPQEHRANVAVRREKEVRANVAVRHEELRDDKGKQAAGDKEIVGKDATFPDEHLRTLKYLSESIQGCIAGNKNFVPAKGSNLIEHARTSARVWGGRGGGAGV